MQYQDFNINFQSSKEATSGFVIIKSAALNRGLTVCIKFVVTVHPLNECKYEYLRFIGGFIKYCTVNTLDSAAWICRSTGMYGTRLLYRPQQRGLMSVMFPKFYQQRIILKPYTELFTNNDKQIHCIAIATVTANSSISTFIDEA